MNPRRIDSRLDFPGAPANETSDLASDGNHPSWTHPGSLMSGCQAVARVAYVFLRNVRRLSRRNLKSCVLQRFTTSRFSIRSTSALEERQVFDSIEKKIVKIVHDNGTQRSNDNVVQTIIEISFLITNDSSFFFFFKEEKSSLNSFFFCKKRCIRLGEIIGLRGWDANRSEWTAKQFEKFEWQVTIGSAGSLRDERERERDLGSYARPRGTGTYGRHFWSFR